LSESNSTQSQKWPFEKKNIQKGIETKEEQNGPFSSLTKIYSLETKIVCKGSEILLGALPALSITTTYDMNDHWILWMQKIAYETDSQVHHTKEVQTWRWNS